MQLKQPTNKGFRALIISPTRELASQVWLPAFEQMDRLSTSLIFLIGGQWSFRKIRLPSASVRCAAQSSLLCGLLHTCQPEVFYAFVKYGFHIHILITALRSLKLKGFWDKVVPLKFISLSEKLSIMFIFKKVKIYRDFHSPVVLNMKNLPRAK